jgi:hypothetical protein
VTHRDADATKMTSAIAIGIAAALGTFVLYTSIPRCVSWYVRRRAFRRWEKIRGN